MVATQFALRAVSMTTKLQRPIIKRVTANSQPTLVGRLFSGITLLQSLVLEIVTTAIRIMGLRGPLTGSTMVYIPCICLIV